MCGDVCWVESAGRGQIADPAKAMSGKTTRYATLSGRFSLRSALKSGNAPTEASRATEDVVSAATERLAYTARPVNTAARVMKCPCLAQVPKAIL